MDWQQQFNKLPSPQLKEQELYHHNRKLARHLIDAPQDSTPVIYAESRTWVPREYHLQMLMQYEKALLASQRRETELEITNRRLNEMFKKAVESTTVALQKNSVKQMRGILKKGYKETLAVPSDTPN